MWRRASAHLRTLAPVLLRRAGPTIPASRVPLSSAAAFRRTTPLSFADHVGKPATRTVEDEMPIATGLEREEIEAELQGKKRFDMDAPVGPFGTKEAPAVIQSYYNKRLVGCSGGEGEDEHDVVWFWLQKEKPYECPVCSQYFVLEVVGEGGDPDPPSDDDDEHY